MTTIWDIYEFVQFVTDKVRNGYVTPEEVSRALDAGQQALHQHYMPADLGKDASTNEAMSPFFKTVQASSGPTGVYAFPAGFAHILGVYKRNGSDYGKGVDVVLHTELDHALESVIYPIKRFPRYLYQENSIKIFPNESTDIFFHYIAQPSTPVIAFTVSGNEIVYDPANSVQLDFRPKYWIQVIQLSMPYLGVNLNSQEVSSLFQTFNPEQ